MERPPISPGGTHGLLPPLPMEDPKVGATAPVSCCVMAPGAVSLAKKPEQKLVVVPLDLAPIQPLHPFHKSRRDQPLLSPGWATVLAYVAGPGAYRQGKRRRSCLVLYAIRSTFLSNTVT